jgi:phosphoenolpyruvate carboxylase
VRLVLTAHPTESRRRSVLAKLVRIAELLRRLDSGTLAPEDEADLRASSPRRSRRSG